jgi:hypothetical protein
MNHIEKITGELLEANQQREALSRLVARVLVCVCVCNGWLHV